MSSKKKKKKKQKETLVVEPPTILSEDTTKLIRNLWHIKPPTLGKLRKPRTRHEIFKNLKEGRIKLKPNAHPHISVEYETEGTEEAEKREKFKYIKDYIQKSGPVKKRKVRKEYVFIKGYDTKGNLELWKTRHERKPKPEKELYKAPPIYESVLGNDLNRIQDAIELIKKQHNKRSEPRTIMGPGLYDRMSDDFLSLFDEDVINEDGKKRRFTSLEFVIMDPDDVAKIIEPYRTPILKRLKKFEEERDEKKREKPMLENEKQKYVRKFKADEAKKQFFQFMTEYIKENSSKGKYRMKSNELIKYRYKLKEFERRINTLFEEIISKYEKYGEVVIKNEVEDALRMRKEMLEEEIMIAATQKEKQLEYSYRHMFLPIKLSEQKESYQLDMNSYIQYWTKKLSEIEKEVKVQKQYLATHVDNTKILQTVEHIPLIKESYIEKVKKVQEEGLLQVEVALLPLKDRIETLQNLRQKNTKMINSVRHYEHIIPEFIRKIREFLRITHLESPQKERFMQALDNIEEFRQELLNENQRLKKIIESEPSGSLDDMSKTTLSIEVDKEPEVKEEEEEEEVIFGMAHRILSDGDLEEGAKQFLKVKFIVADLLTRVIEIALPQEPEEPVPEESESTEKSTVPITEEREITKRCQSWSTINKLLEANKKLDDMFDIVGDKYSIPNLGKMGQYFNKRTASVEKMLEKHHIMLENKQAPIDIIELRKKIEHLLD